MVMNPTTDLFEILLQDNLEPTLYNFDILHAFGHFLNTQKKSIMFILNLIRG